MSVFGHLGPNDRENHGQDGRTFDRRTMRTQRALFEALIEMILERDYETISVSEIAERANVGRSTFYAHFTDKDDLLRSGVGHFRSILASEHAAAANPDGPSAERVLGFSRFMFEHLKEQRKLWRALMRGGAGAIVLERFRSFLADLVRGELVALAKERGFKAPPEATVQFIVGAHGAILTWWLDRGAKEPVAEMDAAFRKLALHGLQGVVGDRG